MRGIFLLIITAMLLNFIISPAFSTKNNEIKPQIMLNTVQRSEIQDTAYQGDTVFITVNSNKKLISPYFVYQNKKIPIFKVNEGIYRGLLGLDAFTKTGNYKLIFKDSSNYLSDSKYLDVKIKRFPVQNITLTGSKGGLTATNDELYRVGRAKSALSSVAYWTKRPLTNPTAGCISSVYGLNRYYNGMQGGFHKGVDIKAPEGQEIVATAGGTILIARQFRLHGGTVAVDHGQGLVSIYLHMSKISVKEGQTVKESQKIGEVGSTGIATGPHLHWGLYVNGTPVDQYVPWVKSPVKCNT